jgi:Flp pilus assembly protein TadD
VLRPLIAEGASGNTLVVVTADHGESLGEHGEKTHGIFAYEATLRVPLIVFDPALMAPRVVADPVRHVDLLPTILDALALPLPPDLPGRSLLALAAGGREAPAPSYFEALTAAANRGWAPLHGIVRDEHKYVRLPVPELYALRSDPQEATNLAATEPARLDALGGLLALLPLGEASRSRRAESGETRETLASLGYLAASAAPKDRYTEADDPKRLIEYESRLEDVVSLQATGDLAGALRLGRDLLARQPDSPVALLHVATLEREAGNLEGACALLKHGLAVNPREPQVAAFLGRVLVEAGRPEEAIAALRTAVSQPEPDVDVLMADGAALAAAGRPAEALQVLGRARVLDPSNALCALNLGTVHLMSGRLDAARTAFVAALEAEPSLARAHTSMGVLEARASHAAAAIEHWKKAVTLNPREWDALYNLGVFLQKEGRPAEARGYLERFARDAPAFLYQKDIAEVRRVLGAEKGSRG